MIDLALDPSETRRAPEPTGNRAAGRPWTRIAVLSLLGVAGTGAFAAAASTYLSGLAGPQRVTQVITGQKAADWPDLKDGLPALANGSPSAVPKVREILPPEPTPRPAVEARIEPILRSAPATAPDAVSSRRVAAGSGPDAPAVPGKTPPAIVEVAVIGPERQAALVTPARSVPGLAPRPSETVRARTGNAMEAALPPEALEGVASSPRNETIKPEIAKPEAAKVEPSRPEPHKAKPRMEAHAKPQDAKGQDAKGQDAKSKTLAAKPPAEKSASRKPATAEASAAPVEVRAQDEDTEVFGIKVPSLAPAGRKIRESVEALGDAVKGIPDRF